MQCVESGYHREHRSLAAADNTSALPRATI